MSLNLHTKEHCPSRSCLLCLGNWTFKRPPMQSPLSHSPMIHNVLTPNLYLLHAMDTYTYKLTKTEVYLSDSEVLAALPGLGPRYL
jgi:hypothetical protein